MQIIPYKWPTLVSTKSLQRFFFNFLFLFIFITKDEHKIENRTILKKVFTCTCEISYGRGIELRNLSI